MDIADLDALRKSHLVTSFIYHTTKQGRFKGVNTRARGDVIIEVGSGEAKATGRFGEGGGG